MLVSVVIPCYNCEKWVERAITSVMAQTYPTIELLLVDNNSTDNTGAILLKYKNLYADKITVYFEAKKGACAARNLGLQQAKGEWIQFLDADDEILPDKITNQLKLIYNDASVLILEGYTNIKTDIYGRTETSVINIADDIWVGLIKTKLGLTSANLWKRSAVIEVGGWDETLSSSQEYDLLFRIIKSSAHIKKSSAINTIINVQANSISTDTNIDKRAQILKNRYELRKQIRNYLLANSILTPYYDRILLEYLYFNLIKLASLDLSYYKQEVINYSFSSIPFTTKLRLYNDSMHHNITLRFMRSNPVLKYSEYIYFLIRNSWLLK